ncbi:hypothetical protein Dxin01_03062 [Deinococcus xinjiangensis]|uniref:Helix-turn-helix domain-containing protein n=1 Tax=Deinococcus xinjiangensis TaxID=457454 RepID=A0ABP9VDI7_9DEIO
MTRKAPQKAVKPAPTPSKAKAPKLPAQRLNVPRIAAALGCSAPTVTRLIETGQLDALDVRTRTQHAYRISPADLARFESARSTAQEAQHGR